MNKLIIFPLFIMILIAITSISITLTASNPESATDITANTGIVVNDDGQYEFYNNGEYEGWFKGGELEHPYDPRSQPDDEFYLVTPATFGSGGFLAHYDNLEDFNDHWSTDFVGNSDDGLIYNILDTNILWGVVIAILGASVVFGVSVFGSGLSEFAQKMLYLSVGWGVIWAFLSVVSLGVLSDDGLDIFGPIIYFGLTFMFIIGIMLEATGADG